MSGGVGEGGGVKLTHLWSQIQQTEQTIGILSIKKILIKYKNNRFCYMDDQLGIRTSCIQASVYDTKRGHFDVLRDATVR